MRRLLPLLVFFLIAPCMPASATSVISRVGSCSGVTSCTPPTHQNSDLFIAYAFRNGSATQPTLPAGWTLIAGGLGLGNAVDLIACKVATGAAETITGFTNATGIIGIVYRNTTINSLLNCQSLTIGNQSTNQASTGAVLSYDGFTLTDLGSTSWILACGGSDTGTDVGTAPTGTTNITTAQSGHVGCADTNAVVNTWTTQTVTVNASSSWQTAVIEIRACTTAVCFKGVVGGSAAGPTTTVATAAVPHAAGNKLIAVVRNTTIGTNTTGVANTAGGTWALCTGSRESTILHIETWETTGTNTANASDTVTATLAANDTVLSIFVYEISGLLPSACDTATIANCVACTTLTSPSFSPSVTGNYSVANVQQAGAVTFTAGANYILDIATNTGTQHRLGAPSGAQTAAITASPGANMGMSVASFKAAQVGGAGLQVGGFLVGP